MPGIFGATRLGKNNITGFDDQVNKVVEQKARDDQEFAEVVSVFVVERAFVKKRHGIGAG